MASSAKDIQLRELKDTVSQLKTMVSEQTELIRSLRLMIDEKSSHEKALQEQVDYLTKKLFGSSSERRSDDIPGQQNLFDEAEVEQDPSLLEEETVIKEHTRKRKATHEDLFKGLNVEKVVIPLPEEEQICPDLPAYRLHDLRHTFFTLCSNIEGISELSMIGAGGHSSIPSSKRYQHPMMQKMLADMEKLEKRVDGTLIRENRLA